MRLIDADKLLDALDKVEQDCENACIIPSWTMAVEKIKRQPTAYDVDKVVEKLEEEREISYADFDRYVKNYGLWLDAEYDDFFHRGLERAARIVKRGGTDEG